VTPQQGPFGNANEKAPAKGAFAGSSNL